jgi:hypothetical protein
MSEAAKKKYTMHELGMKEFSLEAEGIVVEIPNDSEEVMVSANGKVKLTIASGPCVWFCGWLNHNYFGTYVGYSGYNTMILVENLEGRSLKATVTVRG